MRFEKASERDIGAVTALWGRVCEYLEAHVNYPHWKKGVYPAEADAEAGIADGTLYVCRDGETLLGTLRLSHVPEAGYAGVRWHTPDDYARILVLYTLAVDPAHMRRGVGRAMLAAAERLAADGGCTAMRLDAVRGNLPAEALYARCGFSYVATKSLGYEAYGIPLYDLFEKVLPAGLESK